MKRCSKCKETKAKSEFGRHKGMKDGLSGWCKECHRESTKKYRECNLEKVREADRKFKRKIREEDPGRYRENQRKWAEANRERMSELRKEKRRENRFETLLNDSKSRAKKNGYEPCNATPAELEESFARGHGCCQVCGVPELELHSKLHLDHSHAGDGHFRGFLCYKCNHALGLLGDSTEVIINLLHYLMNGVKQT